MAVLAEFGIPDATSEELMRLEAMTSARGEAAGGPPYPGCMFLAVVPDGDGFRFTSVWRTEAHLRAVLDDMLGPDAREVGVELTDVTVSPVISMAIPGTGA